MKSILTSTDVPSIERLDFTTSDDSASANAPLFTGADIAFMRAQSIARDVAMLQAKNSAPQVQPLEPVVTTKPVLGVDEPYVLPVEPDIAPTNPKIVLGVDEPWVQPSETPELGGTTRNDTLTGTDADDVIRGYRGDDVLRGGNGDDLIFGGSGNDTLYGGLGHDTLRGGAGDDVLHLTDVGYNGASMVSSSRGYNDFGTEIGDHGYGGVGNDTIYGSFRADYMHGGDGDDYITDLAFMPIGRGEYAVNMGHDTMIGGAGNDTMVGTSGTAGYTMRGGAGADTFVYDMTQGYLWAQTVGGPITVTDFEPGVDQLQAMLVDRTNMSASGSATYDPSVDWTLEVVHEDGITIVRAIDGNHPTNGVHELFRLNGIHELTGTFTSTPGSLAVNLTVTAVNRVVGTAGNDYLTFDGNGTIALGGDGNDLMTGGYGAYEAFGGAGNDTIQVMYGDGSVVHGEDGNDFITTLAQDVTVYGGNGDDQIYGHASTMPGAVRPEGNAYYGEAGNDSIAVYNQRSAYLDGGDDNDTLLAVGDGDHTLVGGNGSDHLQGGAGDDVLIGSLPGRLTFMGSSSSAPTTPELLNAARDVLLGGAGNDTITGFFNFSTVNGGAGDDYIERGTYEIAGGPGFRYIGADNQIHGGAGNDTIIGGERDTIHGGSGDDHITASTRSTIVGGDGNDTIRLSTGSSEGNVGHTVSGGEGNDFISAASGTLRGGAKFFVNDTINGGAGNDTIHGGLGNDILTGGAGEDVFFFDNVADYRSSAAFDGAVRPLNGPTGTTTITDFTIGEDRIHISSFWTAEAQESGWFRFGEHATTQSTIQSIIDRAETLMVNGELLTILRAPDAGMDRSTIVLVGVDASELTVDSFIWG